MGLLLRGLKGKTSSHFLKPLFAFLEVRAKSGLSHMMMVHTQATSLKPLFPLLRVNCRKGTQYILGTAPTFPLFRPRPAFWILCTLFHFSTQAKQALAVDYGRTRSQIRGTIMFNLNQTMIQYAKINKIVSCVLQVLSNIITHK
jgi:hypothetical protein